MTPHTTPKKWINDTNKHKAHSFKRRNDNLMSWSSLRAARTAKDVQNKASKLVDESSSGGEEKKKLVLEPTPDEAVTERATSALASMRAFGARLKESASRGAVAASEKKQQLTVAAAAQRVKAASKAASLKERVAESLQSTKTAIALKYTQTQLPTVHEITSRVYGCWLPLSSGSAKQKQLEHLRDALSEHRGSFVVYNMTGAPIDGSLFDDQVTDCAFPLWSRFALLACPPTLEAALTLCGTIDAWLNADARNVCAVVGAQDLWQVDLLLAELLLYARFTTDARTALAFLAYRLDHFHYVAPAPSLTRHVHFASMLLRHDPLPCRSPYVSVRVLMCTDDRSCSVLYCFLSIPSDYGYDSCLCTR